jgi:sugar phosphate isomerase/epimerase
MQLGIFAKTFDGTTPQMVLGAAARAGFNTVQYNMACSGLVSMPDVISEAHAEDIATAAKFQNVSIAAVSGTYNMVHPDKSVRDRGLARLEVLASRCRAMNTNMITLCTGTRDALDQWRYHPDNVSKGAWRDLISSMEAALSIAEQWEVELGIEPELANVVSSAEKAHQLISELRNPRIRIVLDAANLFERATLSEQHHLISSAIDQLGDRIAMAHAKDRAADGAFVAAGKGVVDYPYYLSRLAAARFIGPLVTHGLLAEEASDAAVFLRGVMAESNVRAT